MNIKIVESDNELLNLSVLAKKIWLEYFCDIIGKSQTEYMIDKFQSYTAMKNQIENGYKYYFIINQNEILGYFGIQMQQDKLFLSKLYLEKQNRGKGYGKFALNEIVKIAKEKGLKEVYLTVNKHNLSTIAMYEKFGFIQTESVKTNINNGFFMDDFIYNYYIK